MTFSLGEKYREALLKRGPQIFDTRITSLIATICQSPRV
jgi:hypothetical protein